MPVRRLLLIASAALLLGSCSTVSSLNPFGDKDKPLPGERRPVFPAGDPYAGPRRLPPPGSTATDLNLDSAAGAEAAPAQ